MSNKIVIGPIDKGLRLDRTAFVIDNDSFPTLQNAYQWRGRVKRKRGTKFLARLQRYFPTVTLGNPFFGGAGTTLQYGIFTSIVGFPNQPNAQIVPKTMVLTIGAPISQTLTDTLGNGVLTITGAGPIDTATINYATGNLFIHFAMIGNNSTGTISFSYYPGIPVMGLEDFDLATATFPLTIGFDTTYSYRINNASIPSTSWDVSYYKNPQAFGSGATPFVPKIDANVTPLTWNGQDYQQFWTTNYQGAMWATNGITVPFLPTNIGMQFAGPSASSAQTNNIITFVSVTATTLSVQITNCPLVIGDFVFANEWTTTGDPLNANTLNFQTGYVTNSSINNLTPATKTITITFPDATIAADTYVPGILQYLTNRSNTTNDNIRWYDGDPTNSSATAPAFDQGQGWVNFMPPLSEDNFSISELPPAKYYLVGARMILPFKDRLVFLGVVVQSSTSTPFYLQDTVVYSANGSPYYTASFPLTSTQQITSPDVTFNPLLVPANQSTSPSTADQTAFPPSYFSDSTGFGGSSQVNIDEPINTASLNEDVLILGMATHQVRMVYSGNDIIPFIFFIVNSELGSSSVFAFINMDKGVLTRGSRGFIIANQNQAERFDLPIPDAVFQTNTLNNGIERICAQRNFETEWIKFTYSNAGNSNVYPNYTLQYNYRDQTWASFFENYTTYGSFIQSSQVTWATLPYQSWAEWDVPWDETLDNAGQPVIIGGNQQGFVLVTDEGISEDTSLFIQGISGNVVTSANHCLVNGEFILIENCLGTFSSYVNGFIFQVSLVTTNTFAINPIYNTGTYLGNGTITKVYRPFIQTKQFPVAWDMARKTRLGVQMYLLTKTFNSQITLLIYLSQNATSAYNTGPIVPQPQSTNNSLIYSTVLYTCPESTNLGLLPANSNLQMPTANYQEQIWHRINTSLIGDTVQLGFTVSDAQMTQIDPDGPAYAITGATNANPCVLTCTGLFVAGSLIQIVGVGGMTQLNYNPLTNNFYSVLASDPTTVTINIDSTSFGAYTTSMGTAQQFSYTNLGEEIELHSAILNVSPSSMLA